MYSYIFQYVYISTPQHKQEEFVQVMLILSEPTELEKQKRIEQDLFHVFTEFDTDRSGTIDITELKAAMEKMGKLVSAPFPCTCWSRCDISIPPHMSVYVRHPAQINASSHVGVRSAPSTDQCLHTCRCTFAVYVRHPAQINASIHVCKTEVVV
jgi:hypothetical protein